MVEATKRFPIGVFEPQMDWWGISYTRVPDPLADCQEFEILQRIHIPDNFPKIPRKLWNKVVLLFKHYAFEKLGALEAAVGIFFRWSHEDGSPQWQIVVPSQEVAGGFAKYDYKKGCDIETGEPCNSDILMQEDWTWVSRTHSHNTMNLPTPSPIDDDLELQTPQLCLLLSNMKEDSFQITLTAVRTFDMFNGLNERYSNIPGRNNLVWSRVIEATEEEKNELILPYPDENDEGNKFHPNCHNYIKKWVPPAPVKPRGGTVGWTYKPAAALPPASNKSDKKGIITLIDVTNFLKAYKRHNQLENEELQAILFGLIELEFPISEAADLQDIDIFLDSTHGDDISDPFHYRG